MNLRSASDVLILGGGAIGVCCAYYLHRAGCRVTVLDQGEIGSACSAKNAGLIVPSHIIPLAAPGVLSKGLKWMFHPESPFYLKPRVDWELLGWLWQFRKAATPQRMQTAIPVLHSLLQESRRLHDELAATEALDFSLAREGILMVCESEEGFEEEKAAAEIARKTGVRVELLDAAQLHRLDAATPANAIGAVYYPDDAHFDPAVFVQALRRYLEQGGVVFRPHTRATGFDVEGRRIRAVRTEAGTLAAGIIVLAAGSWSGRLARELHLRLPLQPAKGYSFMVPGQKPMPRIPAILSEARVVLTPLPQGLRVAGTLELGGMETSVNMRRVAAMRRAVMAACPDMHVPDISRDQVWAGLRPCSPDGLPYIGRAPRHDNLLIATGHAMLGMTLAPATGKLVAEIVCDTEHEIDLTALQPTRFASGGD